MILLVAICLLLGWMLILLGVPWYVLLILGAVCFWMGWVGAG